MYTSNLSLCVLLSYFGLARFKNGRLTTKYPITVAKSGKKGTITLYTIQQTR